MEFWLRKYLVVLGLQGAMQMVLSLCGAMQLVLSLQPVLWLRVGYTAGTQSTMVNCWLVLSLQTVQKVRRATDQEIIWYQVYGKRIDGILAIGNSLFVLRLRKAMGGV